VDAETLKDDSPNSAEDSTELIDAVSAIATVTAERDQLAAEKAEFQDRFLRSQAEFQNLRRRIEKEKVEWHERAATEAVRTLIPILDDFERALKLGGGGTEYGKGMELIFQRLFDTLKKLGLEPIDSQGQPFDPHVHHAVEKQETEEVSADTVLEEYQRGYNFKGQLLRPAMVKVAVAPASKSE
jgi:molecular chaperone GrpE